MTETKLGAVEDTTKQPQAAPAKPGEPERPVRSGMAQTGTRAFLWTLAVLAALVAAYAFAHVITFRDHGQVHYDAGISAGTRQDLLVTAALLEGQLETPMAIADSAIQALFHDLEQSVVRSETSGEVTQLFAAAAETLASLGIRTEVAGDILQPAQSQGTQLVAAPEAKREVPQQLLHAELGMAQAWALDALGAEALVDQVKQLKPAAEDLGYAADSEVGQMLASIEQVALLESSCPTLAGGNGLESGRDSGGPAMGGRLSYLQGIVRSSLELVVVGQDRSGSAAGCRCGPGLELSRTRAGQWRDTGDQGQPAGPADRGDCGNLLHPRTVQRPSLPVPQRLGRQSAR